MRSSPSPVISTTFPGTARHMASVLLRPILSRLEPLFLHAGEGDAGVEEDAVADRHVGQQVEGDLHPGAPHAHPALEPRRPLVELHDTADDDRRPVHHGPVTASATRAWPRAIPPSPGGTSPW